MKLRIFTNIQNYKNSYIRKFVTIRIHIHLCPKHQILMLKLKLFLIL